MSAERSQQDMISFFRHLALHRPAGPMVRVGARGDGGYVMLDSFDGVDSVVSIGIGGDTSFDDFFLDRGIPVHQFDGTVEASPSGERARFARINLGAMDTPNTLSLRSMMRDCVPTNSDAILKFDVEGAEWEAFATVGAHDLAPCQQIVCELHDLPGIQFKPGLYEQAMHVADCLTRNHCLVHFHINNCCGVSLRTGLVIPNLCEMSFVRKDLVALTKLPRDYPTAQDWPSISADDEVYLDVFRF